MRIGFQIVLLDKAYENKLYKTQNSLIQIRVSLVISNANLRESTEIKLIRSWSKNQ